MGKKIDRNMGTVGDSQRVTEKTTQDKFSDTQSLAHGKQESKPASTPHKKRISPQISCTVPTEIKELLDDLTMFAILKVKKPLNTSAIIRALIQHGEKTKNDIEWV